MKSLLEPVELNRETTQALDEIRSGVENPLFGTASADAEEKIYRSVLPLIEGAGLPNHYVIHYRWFLREVAKLWRTREGRDLAFHLELCIRKWINLGLESRTLQFLVSEAHQRLKGKILTTKTPSHQEVQMEPENAGTPEPQTSTANVAKPEHSAPQSHDFSLPGIMAGPRPPARSSGDSTAETRMHRGPEPDSSGESVDGPAASSAESHPYAGDHKPVQDSDWMEGLA